MAERPKRIQRKRTPGWRMPEGAVYVGRGSKWGNPWKIGERVARGDGTVVFTAADCVAYYRAFIGEGLPSADQIRAELRGRDLACFCPPDAPCHADVLLELANKET